MSKDLKKFAKREVVKASKWEAKLDKKSADIRRKKAREAKNKDRE